MVLRRRTTECHKYEISADVCGLQDHLISVFRREDCGDGDGQRLLAELHASRPAGAHISSADVDSDFE
jgi:hypothetical protein